MDAGNDLSDRIEPWMSPGYRLAVLGTLYRQTVLGNFTLDQLFELFVKEAAIQADEFSVSQRRSRVDILKWTEHVGQTTLVLDFFYEILKSLNLPPYIKKTFKDKIMNNYAKNNVSSYNDR